MFKKLENSRKNIHNLTTDLKMLEKVRRDNIRLLSTLEYISKDSKFPIMNNESAKYFKIGEDMYKDMLEEVNNAKKFIFLEYFII